MTSEYDPFLFDRDRPMLRCIYQVAIRDAYAHIVTATIARADAYIDAHPTSDNPDASRRAWVAAAYKLTYDPEYATYTEVDWSKVDDVVWREGIYEDLVDEFDAMDVDEVDDAEKRLSYPWVFANYLFMLLQ